MMKTVLRTLITVDVKCASISRSARPRDSNRELVTVALLRDEDPRGWVWSEGVIT